MPQIATEELCIALRLQTLVRQIIRATLEQERELEQLWKLNKPRSLQTFLVPPRWDQVFASSAAFGAAFEFFAQLCELGNALAVHRSAAGVPDSDISPGIVLLWHFKSRRILGWTFQI